MLEQLKAARFLLRSLSGTLDVNELRKKVIADAGAPPETKYEDLPPDEKGACDEAVATLQELSGVFGDVLRAKARLTKDFFNALKHEGFSDEHALHIVAHQPVQASSGD